MAQLTFKSLEQAVADMLRWYYYRTAIEPDSNEGAILRTLFESWGFEVEQLSYRFDEALRDAIPEAVFEAFGFERQEAQAAFVVLRFSRAQAASQTYSIPTGTQAQTNSSVVFATLADAQLDAGTTYVDVLAQCLIPGEIGNVVGASVTQLANLIPGVEAVTNLASAYGGADAESLDDQKKRFARYLATLAKGTAPAMAAAALSVVTESEERASKVLIADTYTDAAIPIGTCQIYLYRQGGVSLALKDAVLAELELSQRPVGVQLSTLGVTVVPVTVTVTIEADSASQLSSAEEATYRFFDALEIGEDVDYERLIAAIAHASSSIYSVKLTAPSADVAITQYQRAELGSLTINYAPVTT